MMKKSIILILIAGSFYVTLIGQTTTISPKLFVLSQVEAMKTDGLTLSQDDLKSIGNSINNSRIVVLAEPDHFELETTKAQIEIIKYLTEKKDFEIVLLESDFWALNINNDCQNPKDKVYGFLSKSCPVMNGFWKDINASKNQNLKVLGYDTKHHSAFSKTQYVDSLKHLLNRENIILPNGNVEFLKSLDNLLNGFEYTIERPENYDTFSNLSANFQRNLKIVKSKLKQVNDKKYSFWIHELESLSNDIAVKINLPLGEKYIKQSLKLRNKQNAENLLYLINEVYPNKKIIVWSTTYHGSRAIKGQKYANYTEGGILEQHLGQEELYIMAFSCGGGEITTGAGAQFPIPPNKKEGLEDWLNQETKYAFGIVDYRNNFKKYRIKNKGKKFRMKVTLFGNTKGNWFEVFDSVFYIRNCSTCK